MSDAKADCYGQDDLIPNSIPAWAMKAASAVDTFGYGSVPYAIARLLVATREAALADLSRIFLAKWARHGAEFSVNGVMLDAVDAAKDPS